jgi:hypothetical protein
MYTYVLILTSFPSFSSRDPRPQYHHHQHYCRFAFASHPLISSHTSELEDYSWFEKWRGSAQGSRPAEYEEFKSSLAANCLKVFYEKRPDLVGKVGCPNFLFVPALRSSFVL